VQVVPGHEDELATHRKLLRDPWGLDRIDSRYTTAEVRAVTALAVAPVAQPTPANGKGTSAAPRGKGKRPPRR